ncbi:MAG: DUF885 domain-containing protein [Phycisphaeraceae bacterium]|nr:DUF885 domain-containing protein [Phycisphaeraceae bacterium]
MIVHILCVLVLGIGCSAAAPGIADGARGSPELNALLDEYVERTLRDSPLWASQRGDLRFNDRLPDLSYAAFESRRGWERDLRARLRQVVESGLEGSDRIDAALLGWTLDNAIAWAEFFPEQTPITGRSGPQIELPQLPERVPLRTLLQQQQYVARLESIPIYIEQHIQQMRFGMNAGRVPPRIVMTGSVEQCREIASPDVIADPTRSPMYSPFRDADPDDPVASAAREAILRGVLPAFDRLGDFLEREYVPACRDSIGASDGRDGLPAYLLALHDHTTTSMSAREIHDLGRAEVARIRAEMMDVIRRTDWFASRAAAGLPSDSALLAEFIQFLRTDSRFYHKSPEALISEYRDIAKRVDAELPRMFGTLPRLCYGVRPMPAIGADTSPTAYYYPGSMRSGIPGYFVANTHALDQRPRYEMIALTLHEAVPGHHLQISLSDELEGLHQFRTMLGFTAFVEGWALYAERLGLEMGEHPIRTGGRGLYEDPYDDFGRLTYEMWRACRLVVDTGIHAMGWSREQAVEFMLANSALSRHNIESEVDRYIGWPGQACGYKIGELKIRELRARAESALGDGFDLRRFHDAVLLAGALPLKLLEERIDAWIESEGAG